MKKFLFIVSAAAVLVLGSVKAFSDDTILLEKKNTVSLREEYTQSSVDTIKQELIALSQTLPAKEPIYLYLNTPGGSVTAGNALIAVMKGIKNPIHVIAEFAASMGYLTEQAATGKRFVRSDGTLMAHRAYLGVEGQTPGQISTRLAFFQGVTDDLANMAANRTGISLQAYQDKVKDEYWVSGVKAVKANQADEVVNVACSADLNGTTEETLYTIFGPVELVWANCPLISGPVDIRLPSRGEGMSDTEYFIFTQTVKDMLTKPKLDIVNDVNLENTYQKYVK